MKDIVERFLKYVSIDTTAKEIKEDGPSNESEFELAHLLMDELKEFNPDILEINKFGTVHALFKVNKDIDCKNSIALLAHLDTSPSAKGSDIKPRIIDNYDGKTIELSDGIYLDPKAFPSLKRSKNHSLIVTDGTTLLGGDDKAGVAIIMDLLSKLDRNNFTHSIEVFFTTDEEIGIDYAHIDMDKVVSKFGYTVDGGDILYLANENFNAMSMQVTVNGFSIHPGSAYNKMINALNVFNEFHSCLPKLERPEHTKDREGFYHLMEVKGDEEKTTAFYIIRDFDKTLLNHKLEYAQRVSNEINQRYNKSDLIEIKSDLTYENMGEKLKPNSYIMNLVKQAYKRLKLPLKLEAIRGGTTGAHLAFMGLPCPNLGTGDYNCHGRFEYVDIDQMKTMVNVLLDIFNN